MDKEYKIDEDASKKKEICLKKKKERDRRKRMNDARI